MPISQNPFLKLDRKTSVGKLPNQSPSLLAAASNLYGGLALDDEADSVFDSTSQSQTKSASTIENESFEKIAENANTNSQHINKTVSSKIKKQEYHGFGQIFNKVESSSEDEANFDDKTGLRRSTVSGLKKVETRIGGRASSIVEKVSPVAKPRIKPEEPKPVVAVQKPMEELKVVTAPVEEPETLKTDSETKTSPKKWTVNTDYVAHKNTQQSKPKNHFNAAGIPNYCTASTSYLRRNQTTTGLHSQRSPTQPLPYASGSNLNQSSMTASNTALNRYGSTTSLSTVSYQNGQKKWNVNTDYVSHKNTQQSQPKNHFTASGIPNFSTYGSYLKKNVSEVEPKKLEKTEISASTSKLVIDKSPVKKKWDVSTGYLNQKGRFDDSKIKPVESFM